MVKLTTTEANIQKLLSCQYDDNVVSMTIFSIDYQVVIMDFLTTGVLKYCTADYLLTTPKISQCDYFIVFSVIEMKRFCSYLHLWCLVHINYTI